MFSCESWLPINELVKIWSGSEIKSDVARTQLPGLSSFGKNKFNRDSYGVFFLIVDLTLKFSP